ncbi:nucleotide exchange factor GrpE [Vagococcus acidifermentans]|uniref:Protein GrpE n=1 Tax=Vagococcus acidifermentans TaxID=564710 RepID=A0A430B0C2_9ENTE|nr:nucleotide exchange factor GrpE [Vagococcus acidifermentans]RSU13790.1 nucleotide exchange factor GrpE [Vagococcus acidifermentans]
MEEEKKQAEELVEVDKQTEEAADTEKTAAEDVADVESLQAKLDEMEDQYLRAQAEIVNMRNRNRKEREELAKYRAQDLAKDLLSALDNLDRALEIDVSDEQGKSLKKGIEMVRESMIHALKQSGVEEIPSMGETFDPNLHQAVQTVPVEGDQKPEEVVQVLQKGYILHDRILRPAMVVVSQ